MDTPIAYDYSVLANSHHDTWIRTKQTYKIGGVKWNCTTGRLLVIGFQPIPITTLASLQMAVGVGFKPTGGY